MRLYYIIVWYTQLQDSRHVFQGSVNFKLYIYSRDKKNIGQVSLSFAIPVNMFPQQTYRTDYHMHKYLMYLEFVRYYNLRYKAGTTLIKNTLSANNAPIFHKYDPESIDMFVCIENTYKMC